MAIRADLWGASGAVGLVAWPLAQVTPFWSCGLLFNSWDKGSIRAHGPEPLASLHFQIGETAGSPEGGTRALQL